MSRDTFDRLRLPIALGVALMLLAGYLFLQRAGADSSALDPGPSIVVGVPGGGVLTPSPSPTLAPIPPPALTPPPAPASTPSPTPEVTPVPTPIPPEEEFVAEVMACESIDEPEGECNDEISRLRGDDETFVALVIFDNARSGDVINVILDGPSGPLEGGAYALPGSGRGYYYSTFAVEGLPNGQYTLTAIRNGEPVARTDLRKGGGGG